MIRTHRQQLVVSMSVPRRGLCTVGVFNLLLFLLSSILVVITCPVRDEPNEFEVDACGPYKSSFVGPRDEFGGLENVCQRSSSFCFPSTVPAFSDSKKPESDLASSDTYGDQREGFSTREQGIFRFIFDRNISCTLFQKEDDYLKFLSSYGDSKNSKLADISHCFGNLVGNKSPVLKSGLKARKFALDDSLITPQIEIKPSSLDWGLKTLYEVSNAFLTIHNGDPERILTVYDVYSSNPQFYSCNFTENVLAPGEIMSICLAFFPTEVGPSTGQLILQTSFGGFLILANGFSVESPYLLKPLGASSNGRWRKGFSLFNPFNEALYVEEVTVLMFTSSGSDSQQATISVCNITGSEVSLMDIALSRNNWFGVAVGELGEWNIALKPHENWEIAPQRRETIMEMDISEQFEGSVNALFGVNVRRSSDDEAFSMVMPVEAEFKHGNARGVSVSLEALVPQSIGGLVFVALSVLNNAPHILSLVGVFEENDGNKIFKIKSVEGLVLFPGTNTQVAVLSYSSPMGAHRESGKNCNLLVVTNDTRNSRVEIPCKDVIRAQSDSSLGPTKETRSFVNYIEEGQRYVIISSPQKKVSDIKGVDTIDADETVLKNWKSQATESGNLNTVLEEKELLFPMVLLGNYSSKTITVRNRSPKPVVMQLILNLAEIVDNCREEISLHQLSSSSSVLLVNASLAPTKYGFSIAKDALTEAHIHPNGVANLGPILFQPHKRCEWRSSALIRNNASGVEWLPLRGFGGSLSLALLEGHDPVRVLDFNLNSLNFGKNLSCPHQPLTKEVNVKNTGDIPLEVVRIKVSGSECGLDGFRVSNCRGFSLLPGETKELDITYNPDFSAPTVRRDLELVLASGVVVMPMKVSIPICFVDFCKRSLFWARAKKLVLGILLAAFVVYLLFGTPFAGFKSFRKPSSPMNSELKNELMKPMIRDEAVLVGERGPENSPAVREKQIDSISSEKSVSRSSSCEKVVDTQQENVADSKILKVKVGKEQGKRRRKKKSSVSKLSSPSSSLFVEVSSSQSSNSTPSSPMSPMTSSSSPTPRRSMLVSPVEASPSAVMKQSDKNGHPKTSNFSKKQQQQQQGSLCADNSPAATAAAATAITAAQDSKKMAGRAILSPSGTFPRTFTAWTCYSPFLGSGLSPIGPCARAPGPEAEANEEDKYIYDIWGDHLFEHAFAEIFRAKKNVGSSGGNSSSSGVVVSSAAALIQNNSDSFFMWDPVAFMNRALMESSSSSSISSNVQVDD